MYNLTVIAYYSRLVVGWSSVLSVQMEVIMSNKEIWNQLGRGMKEQGLKWSMVSVRYLGMLSGEIIQRHKEGQIVRELYQEYLKDFETTVPGNLFGEGSIIVVASPQPMYRAGFTLKGKEYSFTIPPTYFKHTDDDVEQLLKSVFEPAGYGFTRARLPEKLLAVRSGLAQYGRNNITYIDGFGSFYRIRPYYTDLPSIEDRWLEAEVMDICRNCNICVKSCPTGALKEDRFLVQADKCLTFLNETAVPWPGWVESAWDTDSNCIVGCMKCQFNCPGNGIQKNWIEPTEVFSEQETRELLENTEKDRLSDQTIKKLERLYLTEYIPTLSRNLGVLFQSQVPPINE
jgi:epoxyqueuosine reductase